MSMARTGDTQQIEEPAEQVLIHAEKLIRELYPSWSEAMHKDFSVDFILQHIRLDDFPQVMSNVQQVEKESTNDHSLGRAASALLMNVINNLEESRQLSFADDLILETMSVVETTPLCIAVFVRDYDTVELLLENGCNVNGCHSRRTLPLPFPRAKQTPLATAVKHCDITMINLLLSKGADINNDKNDLGMTAIWYLFLNPNFPTRHVLSDSMDNTTRLSEGEFHVLHLLIENGADLNARIINGNSLIHWVNDSVIQLLIESGADVNLRNKCGKTALFLRVVQGKSNEVATLIKNGADVNHRDCEGVSPLRIAVEDEHGEIIATLIKNGAEVNCRDCQGVTRLHIAVNNEDGDTIELLIKCNADTEARDDRGRTPLIWAVKPRTKIEIFELMMSHANPGTQDNKGRTLMHWAVGKGSIKIVKALISFESNHAIRRTDGMQRMPLWEHADDEGMTPLHYTVMVCDSDLGAAIASLLINCGANVFAKTLDGRTPADIKSTGAAHSLILDEQKLIEQFLAFSCAHVDRSKQAPEFQDQSMARWLDEDMMRKVYEHTRK